MARVKRFLKLSAILVLGILFLQLAVSSTLLSPLIVPEPIDVATTLYKELLRGDILFQTAYSLYYMLVAMIISLVLALFMAILSQRFSSIKYIFKILASFFSPLPGVALLPVFLLWFGMGAMPIFATMLHATLWPFYHELLNGLNTVPKIYRSVAQSVNLKGIKKFIHLDFFSITPILIVGMRTAWGRAWRALISVEMIFGAIGTSGGIGWYIFKKRVFFDLPGMFTGLFIVAIIGVIVEKLAFDKLLSLTVQKWGISL